MQTAPTEECRGGSRSVWAHAQRLHAHRPTRTRGERGGGYTLEEVEIFGPDGAPPEHLERHPFGRIPALEHAGFVLYETGAITLARVL
jgi:glutathione S-transferase